MLSRKERTEMNKNILKFNDLSFYMDATYMNKKSDDIFLWFCVINLPIPIT